MKKLNLTRCMPATVYKLKLKREIKKLTFIFLERFYGRKKNSTTILGNRFPAGNRHSYYDNLSFTL